MNLPLVLGAAGVFTAIWAFNDNKKFLKVLPKISKKKGLIASGALFLLATVDYLKEKGTITLSHNQLVHSPPPKMPLAAAGYDKRNDYVGRQPLGSLTGIGREERMKGIPASAVSNFPYSSSRS